jgi:hypothetical protein
MHTKDMLANALRDLGLTEMADRAATGWYHDYLSPLDTPAITLVNDLAVAGSKTKDNFAIMELRERVKNGDFDASKQEGDDWANSDEGREAFRSLLP